MEIPLKATVVIPTRNRSEILEESLSFLAFQDFSKRQFEVLVCDDGSEEDIGVVVDKFRSAFPFLRLLKQDAKGPAAARNLGISEASAPIVIFLDSDVLSDKSLVRHLVRTLDENPQWLGSEARIEPVGNDKSPLWESPTCKNGGHYHTAAVAYRREVLIEVGGLDETFTLPACEDVELAMQILSRGTIGFVPEAVVYHPCRRVNLGLHWRWRRYWKYEMILAKDLES